MVDSQDHKVSKVRSPEAHKAIRDIRDSLAFKGFPVAHRVSVGSKVKSEYRAVRASDYKACRDMDLKALRALSAHKGSDYRDFREISAFRDFRGTDLKAFRVASEHKGSDCKACRESEVNRALSVSRALLVHKGSDCKVFRGLSANRALSAHKGSDYRAGRAIADSKVGKAGKVFLDHKDSVAFRAIKALAHKEHRAIRVTSD